MTAALARKAVLWLLLSIRLMIVPVFVLAPARLSDHALLCLYLLAFITDYFDGASARCLNVCTRGLRKADSAADAGFHLALAFVLFHNHPGLFHPAAKTLAVFLATAAMWYVLDAFRWHRPAGFHTWSAKAFSIGLMVWVVLLLCGRNTGPLFSAILVFGAVSNLEGIIISLRLRGDRADLKSVFHVTEN